MVKITGAKAHAARLKRIRGPRMIGEVGKAIEVAADYLTAEASNLITTGSSGGQNGGKHQHIASSPGDPPNEEFGDLRSGLKTVRTGPLTAESQSTAGHAVPLELGTSKMAERPYMRPAAQKTRKAARALVVKAVKVVTGGGTV